MSSLFPVGVIVRVVPAEVTDGLLQPEEKIHCTYVDVDGGSVACL